LSSRTVMKKYRFERKGRRSFDTGVEYDTAGMMDNEKTRTTEPVVRATRWKDEMPAILDLFDRPDDMSIVL